MLLTAERNLAVSRASELNLVDVVWGDSRKVTGLRDYGKYEALSLMGKNKPP